MAAEGDSRGSRGRQLWRRRATVRVASRQGTFENTVTVCQRLQVGKTGPTTPPVASGTVGRGPNRVSPAVSALARRPEQAAQATSVNLSRRHLSSRQERHQSQGPRRQCISQAGRHTGRGHPSGSREGSQQSDSQGRQVNKAIHTAGRRHPSGSRCKSVTRRGKSSRPTGEYHTEGAGTSNGSQEETQ